MRSCFLLVAGRLCGFAGASMVVASMGATTVLVFGVPHGQLSQPWPVLAGHGISAVIGVACARWIASPELAGACAVGLAIGAMHQFKCIHPPGGATALTAVLGGSAIHELGFGFVLFPVVLNAVVMIGAAFAYNLFFKWRRYPASLNQKKVDAEGKAPSHEKIVAAIRSLDSFVDITEEDLIQLMQILAPTPEEERDQWMEHS